MNLTPCDRLYFFFCSPYDSLLYLYQMTTFFVFDHLSILQVYIDNPHRLPRTTTATVRYRFFITPTGKPPPLAVRLEKALPFRRWVAPRASCGGAPRPRPRPNPKHNAESDGQEAHQTMRQSEKRGRGATHASQPHEGCPLLHPLQGASCLSTPLQGGILKPPALRVVDDFQRVSHRLWR